MRERIKLILEENNLDPFLETVKMIKDDELKAETKAKLLTELMKYVAPQLKSVDIDAKVAGSLKVVVGAAYEAGMGIPAKSLVLETSPIATIPATATSDSEKVGEG